MQTYGFMSGKLEIKLGVTRGQYLIPLVFLGLVELGTAIGTIVWVREGQRARNRAGRSWLQIARSAWATDILKERSFLNLVVSRLLFFGGLGMLLNFYLIFMKFTLHLTKDEQALWINLTTGSVALLTMISTIPSARISDRIGRKPVLYAACAIGALGMGIAAIAPTVQVFLLAAVAIGIASGTFLAVDWALMTDIIPKAASGRFMGISNIAVAAGGPLASIIGGAALFVFTTGLVIGPLGPRVAFALAIWLFILAAFFLRRVDATPRGIRLPGAVATSPAAPPTPPSRSGTPRCRILAATARWIRPGPWRGRGQETPAPPS